MTVIDTHSHIYLEEFDEDRANLIERAEKESVTRILLPAIDSSTHGAMLQTESTFPDKCLSMIGLHPCSVKENYLDELGIVQEFLEKRPFVAVGEIGLDFYWDKTYTDQQYAAFRQQVQWAMKYSIPIAIHSRNSTDECISVVSEHQDGKLKGVFHCFSGTTNQARQIIELGFYLGIGGVITFKNSGLDKVISEIGIGNVILETDAPYLAPVPYRGKRNEPAYLKYVIDRLATITNLPVEEIAAITTTNARKVFGNV